MSLTEIDGSLLEGGGQILRLAMSLSSLLKKPIKVTKIRANRAKGGGLKPQHLKGIEMASEMCDGILEGAEVNGKEITYHPRTLKAGSFEVDTQTAGSIALLMQVGIPIALFAASPTDFVLKGGTNADMAPPVDYTINVFVPILKKFGGHCSCQIRRRGYYPKGGGIVNVQVSPVTSLSPVSMTSFGNITRIWGRSFVAGVLPIKMAHEMADVAQKVLNQLPVEGVPVNIERVRERPEDAVGNGCGIVLFAETSTGCVLGSSALGKRGTSNEEVGMQAAEELAVSIKGQHCLDTHMQDQVIVLMALANGKSVIKSGPPTLHTKTAIYIAEMLSNGMLEAGVNVVLDVLILSTYQIGKYFIAGFRLKPNFIGLGKKIKAMRRMILQAKFKIEEKSDHCFIECDGIGFKSNSS